MHPYKSNNFWLKKFIKDRSKVIEYPNLDLFKRPKVKLPDGNVGTIRSTGFTNDKNQTILLPSITEDGKLLETPKEILDHYKTTGKHLGIYKDIQTSNSWANKLHKQQENYYLKNHDKQ